MGVIRVQKNSNYVVMSKVGLHDDRLSWKAKGLLAYMLSMPDNWTFYNEELMKHSPDGSSTFKAAMKELKEYGYVVRRKKQDEKGRFVGWETIVYEHPVEIDEDNRRVESRQSENRPSVNRQSANRPSENDQLLNNKELNNNLLNNKELVVEQVYQFYQSHFGIPSSYTMTSMNQWINDLSPELVLEALKITYKDGKTWKYTEGILRNWAKDGITSLNDLEKQKEKKSAPRRNGKADVWDAFSNYINSLGGEEDD
jgi:DnaD/phage-associated family protein